MSPTGEGWLVLLEEESVAIDVDVEADSQILLRVFLSLKHRLVAAVTL